ncbi:MAG: hypothetical protein QOH93_438 [Chloroflexia bacterium]|jgi:hypothetical protein|nr:hypothetical protein [Chloroflexia bacterium]
MSDGGNGHGDGKDEYREYDEMTPEELNRARVEMLQEIERRMEARDWGEPPKREPEERKWPWDRPIHINDDVLADPVYQQLSVVGKLTWYGFMITASTMYHMGKPLDLFALFPLTGLTTKFGTVLKGDDMSEGLDELLAAGLVSVEEVRDQVDELEEDNEGDIVVAGHRDVEREVLTFEKYVIF